MKILGVLIQNKDGSVELVGVKGQLPQITYDLDDPRANHIVNIPTPEAIKEEEGIEKSKQQFGVDAIIEKHNAP